jgi:hypothetical protein
MVALYAHTPRSTHSELESCCVINSGNKGNVILTRAAATPSSPPCICRLRQGDGKQGNNKHKLDLGHFKKESGD